MKRTDEAVQELMRLDFEGDLELTEKAALLKISTGAIYLWRATPEYKAFLAAYVEELEEEAVPRALALLIKLVKKGDYQAARTLMHIYKGAKTRLETNLDGLLRKALDGTGDGEDSDGNIDSDGDAD